MALTCYGHETADENLAVQLQELQLAHDETLQDVARLRVELGATRQQLNDLRRSYAELLVSANKRSEELAELRLQLAGVFAGDMISNDSDADTSEVYGVLEKLIRQHLVFYQNVRHFGEYLETVLDVIKPSKVLREEIVDRYHVLLRDVGRLERMPSLVAGRGGSQIRSRQQCRVLTVNDDLQIVVLNAGLDDGVNPGSVWVLTSDSVIKARLKVIESRSAISAAIPVNGSLGDFAPGIVLKREIIDVSG